MSNTIKLKKGLDIPVKGKAENKVLMEVTPDLVAVKPTDFKGLVPKLLVKEGDAVKVGSALFADKMDQEILFTSPVGGTVQSVVRGDKRKLLAVVVKADAKQEFENFGVKKLEDLSAEEIKHLLMKSGLWAAIIQRPYGIVARQTATPKAIFISCFNTAPNAADLEFVLAGRESDIQLGISALKKMSGAEIHLGLDASVKNSIFAGLKDAEIHYFEGKHPAGNVGVQIHNVSPILKGETVWTISAPALAAIGQLLSGGRLDATCLVAVTGSCAKQNGYVKAVRGSSVASLQALTGKADNVRIISGDVLTGTSVGNDGFLGFFDNQVSLVEEGNYREMFGWANPFRTKLFSSSRAYLSWLCPKKQYSMDTNTHGGVRAFMFNTVYTDVLPMHIFPVYLCKACMTSDIDKMERYGIYEVLPEDLATCEFVCPSKVEWQKAISDGIDLMLKEMA